MAATPTVLTVNPSEVILPPDIPAAFNSALVIYDCVLTSLVIKADC